MCQTNVSLVRFASMKGAQGRNWSELDSSCYKVLAVYERTGEETDAISSGSFKIGADPPVLVSENPRRSKRCSVDEIPSQLKKKRAAASECFSVAEAINERFSASLKAEISLENLKSAEEALRESIKRKILRIDTILIYNKDIEAADTMSVKRRMEVDFDEAANAHLLVPQSKWVYNTPDKQKLNKIRFEEPTPELQPAVMRTTKKMKCLYDMREEVVGKIDLNAFSPGQRVCIDKTYLKRVCEISKENQFLSNDSEDSIEIRDFSFALPTRISPKKQQQDEATMDVEDQIRMTCMKRPSKTNKKLSRRNSMERKTLSFGECETTPKKGLLPRSKSDGFRLDRCFTETEQMCTENAVFKDITNQPSTSNGIYHDPDCFMNTDNLFSMQDARTVLESECEFFAVHPWSDTPTSPALPTKRKD